MTYFQVQRGRNDLDNDDANTEGVESAGDRDYTSARLCTLPPTTKPRLKWAGQDYVYKLILNRFLSGYFDKKGSESCHCFVYDCADVSVSLENEFIGFILSKSIMLEDGDSFHFGIDPARRLCL